MRVKFDFGADLQISRRVAALFRLKRSGNIGFGAITFEGVNEFQ